MNELETALQQVRDNNPDEYAKLYSFASAWVKTTFKPFTCEDLKQAYYLENDPPRQLNIFGAVFNALSKEKEIYKHATTYARLPKAHGRLLNKWISKEYRLKQQGNRKAPWVNQVALF